MFKRTRLIFSAVIAALIVSGTATAMAATSDHPKKKATHASGHVPKSKATRTSSAPAQQPGYEHMRDEN
jgi:hypothetical protein